MRTTIELTDDQRAALLSLAAKRGLRGYSSLVQEALAQYLTAPPAKAPAARPGERPAKKPDAFMSFLADGFSTGRRDGSVSHDEYIYRAK